MPEFVLSPVPVSPTVAQLLVLLAERDMLIVAQGQALSALSARVAELGARGCRPSRNSLARPSNNSLVARGVRSTGSSLEWQRPTADLSTSAAPPSDSATSPTTPSERS